MTTITTELGFPVTLETQQAIRGIYDAQRVPEEKASMITWLLGLHFVAWDDIAKHVGVAWETVRAVAQSRAETIREYKGRKAKEISLVLDAAMPKLLEDAKNGKLSVLDLKLLGDMYLVFNGEATEIVDVRHSGAVVYDTLDAVRKMTQEMGLDDGKVLSNAPARDGGILVPIEASECRASGDEPPVSPAHEADSAELPNNSTVPTTTTAPDQWGEGVTTPSCAE